MNKTFCFTLLALLSALPGEAADSLLVKQRYSPAMEFSVKFSGMKFTLESTGNEAISKTVTDRKDLYSFLLDNSLRILHAVDTEVENLPAMQSFAEKLAERAVSTYYDRKINSVMRTTNLDQGYRLSEIYTIDSTYIIYIQDLRIASKSVTNLLRVFSGAYRYDLSAIKNSVSKNYIISRLPQIQAFVKANSEIHDSPEITIKGDTGAVVYFQSADGQIDSLAITKDQANRIRGAESEEKPAVFLLKEDDSFAKDGPKEKPDEKERTGNGSRAKEEPLGGAKTFKCDSSFEFNLRAHTLTTTSDSFAVEANTLEKGASLRFVADVGDIDFVQKVLATELLKNKKCNAGPIVGELKAFHAMLTEAWKNRKQKEDENRILDSAKTLINQARKTINDRIDALASETDYAALLELVESPVLIDVRCKDRTPAYPGRDGAYLKIDSVVIRASNNLIHQIDIIGTINGKKVQTVSNMENGIGLRELIDGPTYLRFRDASGLEHSVCPLALFYVRPTHGEAISYTVKDGSYTFINQPGKRIQLLEQKRLLDFISASAFLDLQAFNEGNPNKNVLTELYFNFNIGNDRYRFRDGWKYNVTSFRYLYTTVALSANIFKEPNFVETVRKPEFVSRDSVRIDTATAPPFFKYDSAFTVKYYLKSFDLVKNAFVQIRPLISLFSIDKKRSNSFIELNAGALLLGSNVRLNDPTRGKDSLVNRPVYSFAPIGELRYRLNPKVRYGVDLHLIYCPKLYSLAADIYPITGRYELETLVNAKMTSESKSGFVQGELNFYFNPRNPVSITDRGGLYFKLNMFKSLYYKDGHVMFLVGYSSDIKNFFK